MNEESQHKMKEEFNKGLEILKKNQTKAQEMKNTLRRIKLLGKQDRRAGMKWTRCDIRTRTKVLSRYTARHKETKSKNRGHKKRHISFRRHGKQFQQGHGFRFWKIKERDAVPGTGGI